jgi:type VII secretion-associated serine protease mycosin
LSRALAALLAVLVLLATALPVAARAPLAARAPSEAPQGAEVVPGEVIVQFREGGRAAELARSRGLTLVTDLGRAAADNGAPALVSTGGQGVDQVIAQLRRDPSVVRVEPNYVFHLPDEVVAQRLPDVEAVDPAAVGVDDPKTNDQYSLDRMRVRDAWSTTTGAGNVVAVLDTGIQFNHPDLRGRIAAGYDFVSDDTNASDDNGHGTWVSGIIAANANDGYGIAGISWSDYIMPLKIMDREGTGNTADLVAAIRWAADHGADVINMSVGGFPHSSVVQDAVDYAWNKGAVLVGAAGNNRRDETYYPASFDHVVSVSATQPEDEFSNWSSYGAKVDVSAPGSSVLTTNCYACTYADHDSWGSHTYISGTSFATPNVSGVVALIRAANPGASPQQVVDRLIGSVTDLGYPGWEKRYGHGRIDAAAAVTGTAALSATATGAVGDSLELNNAAAEATSLGLGTTVNPTIHPAGDVDLFALSLPRAGRLEVRVGGIVDNRAYPWNKSGLPVDPVVEILSSSGSLLRRVDNEWETGTELATWNVSGPTNVLVRVSNWYPNGNPAPYVLRTAFVDEVPPHAVGLRPAPDAKMVETKTTITFGISEPVTGIDATTVTLRTYAGVPIPASVSYAASTRRVTVTPLAPLPSGTKTILELSDTIRDAANLPLAYRAYRFWTMPGETYAPSRRITFAAGTYMGHRIGQSGEILGLRSGTLTKASGASSPQRATFPDLPGAWLYVENGMWDSTWVQESSRAYIGGVTQEQSLPATTRIVVLKGTHTGRTYDAAGTVTGSKTFTITKNSGANVDAMAVINGRRHYHVTNGLFAGTWVRESSKLYRDGFIDRMTISPMRRVLFGAGTHVGYQLDADGDKVRAVSAKLTKTSGASISAWAVVNGTPRVYVVNGIWAGTWVAASEVLAYER